MRPLVLEAAGPQAEPVASLTWLLLWGGAAILLVVLGMIAIAVAGPARWRAALGRERTVFVAGLAIPIVLLATLLVAGLGMTASLGRVSRDELTVRITGYRWWWTVEYPGFASANELVIPVDRSVRIELRSADVIHSFWVPELAGKRDMIPGKVNTLLIRARRAGTFFAICAEYCGGPHALMQFRVHALEPAAYVRWEAAQRRPALPPADPVAARGATLFHELGCGGCHVVRGTRAGGRRGPDLTHVASRSRLAAGILPNDFARLRAWTADPQALKPGTLMPGFGHLRPAELDALARYMDGLQ